MKLTKIYLACFACVLVLSTFTRTFTLVSEDKYKKSFLGRYIEAVTLGTVPPISLSLRVYRILEKRFPDEPFIVISVSIITGLFTARGLWALSSASKAIDIKRPFILIAIAGVILNVSVEILEHIAEIITYFIDNISDEEREYYAIRN